MGIIEYGAEVNVEGGKVVEVVEKATSMYVNTLVVVLNTEV